MVDVIYRPLPAWPHPSDGHRQAQFRVEYRKTLADLKYEVGRLDGSSITLAVGFREGDVRLDGQPRADARSPIHPGVQASFDSKFGALTYATDEYWDWRDNVRAIALGLEALRAVDRHGISRRGEQYAGFAQLTAGGPDPERGKALVRKHGSVREAMKATHPDTYPGREREFADVIAYRDLARE